MSTQKNKNRKEKEEEEIELLIRLRGGMIHPKGAFHVLDLRIVGHKFMPYKLSPKHLKELETVGAKHWLEVKEENPKEVSDNGPQGDEKKDEKITDPLDL